MDDREFRDSIREILKEARAQSFHETAVILELGDEFGEIDYGAKDLAGIMPDVGGLARTTLGSMANVSNKARTLLATILKGLPSLIIPFVSTRYDRISQAEASRQREIERMYPEIFTIARKGYPEEGQLFLFMLNPVVMTTAMLGRLGGDIILDLVDALSGQSPDVITKTRPLRRRVGPRESLSLRTAILGEAPRVQPTSVPKVAMRGGRYSQEPVQDQEQNQRSAGDRDVFRLMKDPQLLQTLQKAEPVQRIMNAAKNSKNLALNQVISDANDVMQCDSIDDLEQMGLALGDEVDRYESQMRTRAPGGVDQVLVTAQKGIIDASAEKLQATLNDMKQKGVPDNLGVIKAYQNTLKRLQDMSSKIKVPQAPAPGEESASENQEPGGSDRSSDQVASAT